MKSIWTKLTHCNKKKMYHKLFRWQTLSIFWELLASSNPNYKLIKQIFVSVTKKKKNFPQICNSKFLEFSLTCYFAQLYLLQHNKSFFILKICLKYTKMKNFFDRQVISLNLSLNFQHKFFQTEFISDIFKEDC